MTAGDFWGDLGGGGTLSHHGGMKSDVSLEFTELEKEAYVSGLDGGLVNSRARRINYPC